jgi:hypothetical protein
VLTSSPFINGSDSKIEDKTTGLPW